MNKRMMIVGLTAVLLLLLAACAPGQGAATAVPPVDEALPQMEESMDETGEMAGDGDMAEDGDMAGDGEMAEDGEMAGDGDMAEDGEMAGEADMAEDGEMAGEAHDGDAAADMEDTDAMEDMDGAEEMSDRPAWQQISLVDAATGEAFTLGGFAGRTVFVEPMATWCSNCRQQLNNVAAARQRAGDDVVFVALSLETTLDPADLARYQQDNGFDWTFAVMPEALLQGLADEFGRGITSAPSTPHFIIRPDGSFTPLSTGMSGADDLLALLAAAGS